MDEIAVLIMFLTKVNDSSLVIWADLDCWACAV